MKPCKDPFLRRVVSPTPVFAASLQNGGCALTAPIGSVHPCVFGYPGPDARGTIALVGDSHAGHWRAAVRQVAQQRRWLGMSATRSGCALNAATRDTPEPERTYCRNWNTGIVRWLRANPRIHTLFVASRASLPVRRAGGLSEFETRVRGYLAAWRRVPASVSRIVVIRDNPVRPAYIRRCIDRAMAARRAVGTSCAARRGAVLRRDAQVEAARRARSPRIRVVDLTSFMCSPRLCFPVVGGALVHKDKDHMTRAFVTSLGPYLLRAVNRLGTFPGDRAAATAPAG